MNYFYLLCGLLALVLNQVHGQGNQQALPGTRQAQPPGNMVQQQAPSQMNQLDPTNKLPYQGDQSQFRGQTDQVSPPDQGNHIPISNPRDQSQLPNQRGPSQMPNPRGQIPISDPRKQNQLPRGQAPISVSRGPSQLSNPRSQIMNPGQRRPVLSQPLQQQQSPNNAGQTHEELLHNTFNDVASHFGTSLSAKSKDGLPFFDLLLKVQSTLSIWAEKLGVILRGMERLFNPSFFQLVTSAKNFIAAFNNPNFDPTNADEDDDDEEDDDEYDDEDYDDYDDDDGYEYY